MEQARLIIAIGLSFLVFFIWDAFFVEKKTVEKATVEQVEPQPAEQLPGTPTEAAAPLKEEPLQAVRPVTDRQSRIITVSTDKYEARLDERGAAITGFKLKDYKDSIGENAAMLELVPDMVKGGTVHVYLEDNSREGMRNEVFSAGNTPDQLTVNNQPMSVEFSWMSESGLEVIKKYTFTRGTYLIDMDVTVINRSATDRRERLSVELVGVAPKKTSYAFEGPSAYIDEELEQIKIKSIKKKNIYKGKIEWIALEERYFLTSLLIDSKNEGSFELATDSGLVTGKYVHPARDYKSGKQVTYRHQLFFGPKQMDLLNAAGRGLGNLINFGFFDILAKPCLKFMNLIYSVIPNYGLAIILITIIIKIVLWPLGSKSYKSMNEMKRVQPLMAEIKEKYKNDKKKQNEETMALYKTYKINPMGGCLPMVVQIPVFFALYRMLYGAIELRHAPFIGWINDLSAPDRLFSFGFSIPFMQPPYGIPVLTLIMGATMFLQQKMSPPMGDPAQAKMMMLMPIVFTFIFINFSSGLVLYWLVNNVLSISQQYYIQKKFA